MPLTIDTNLFAVSLFAKEAFDRKGQKGFCVVFDVLIREIGVNDGLIVMTSDLIFVKFMFLCYIGWLI